MTRTNAELDEMVRLRKVNKALVEALERLLDEIDIERNVSVTRRKVRAALALAREVGQ